MKLTLHQHPELKQWDLREPVSGKTLFIVDKGINGKFYFADDSPMWHALEKQDQKGFLSIEDCEARARHRIEAINRSDEKQVARPATGEGIFFKIPSYQQMSKLRKGDKVWVNDEEWIVEDSFDKIAGLRVKNGYQRLCVWRDHVLVTADA